MTNLGDTNVHVWVNGTTFGGIYEIIGSTLELTSADFGERSVELGNRPELSVAEQLLRDMVQDAMSSGTLFVRDNGTLAD